MPCVVCRVCVGSAQLRYDRSLAPLAAPNNRLPAAWLLLPPPRFPPRSRPAHQRLALKPVIKYVMGGADVRLGAAIPF